MAARTTPPIVAELGRPETPEETAARKAETSRKHRANQTMRNLVWSLIATLVVVLVLVLVVVRPDPPAADPIDYRTIASQSQDSVAASLAAPSLDSSWSANAAEVRRTAGVTVWYVGFITPSEQFIALNQGIDANPTWVDAVLGTMPTGSTTIAGVQWTVYDHRDAKSPGNSAYGLVATINESTFVLHGTATDAEFALLAAEVTSA